jgi:pimeloyl-ACP methyl ester carboxylesterase
MECRTRKIRYAAADGFHDLAWTHWGAPELTQRAICVHGLTRLGRDFDALAKHLVLHGWQVACPDLPGRGGSDWLQDASLYTAPTYLSAISHLLGALDWRDCVWVGSSLGGIVGMLAASMPGTPVRKLVLNDIGAEIPRAALVRIKEYLGLDLAFDGMAELEAHLRAIHAPFGPLTDSEWCRMAETSARRRADGRLRLHYDPAIAVGYTLPAEGDVLLWPVWQRVSVPTLILRGESSDILPAPVAARMAERPGVALDEIPGCGHAPALLAFEQVARVAAFLDG